jgi:hypothetical protein
MPTDPDAARQVLLSLPGTVTRPTGRKVNDLSSYFEDIKLSVSLQAKLQEWRSRYAHQLTMLQCNITRLEIAQRKACGR